MDKPAILGLILGIGTASACGGTPEKPPFGSSEANAGGAGQDTTDAACPSSSVTPGDSTQTVRVDGVDRQYILHVPSTYDGTKTVPLVVDFHPIGGTAQGERSSSPYSAETDPEGVITAYPNGTSGPMGNAWNVGGCCVADTDDIAFAKALVEKIEETACIDPQRVYAVGFSMGGGMSHYIACHANDVFAAVAPAAFDLLEENVEDCVPSRPISVISFRSTTDPVVPYAGGYSDMVPGMAITFLGAERTFEHWAEVNGCTGSPSAPDAHNCQTHSSCKDGVQVTLCTKEGGGHEPGDAEVGWPFLKQFTLPVNP